MGCCTSPLYEMTCASKNTVNLVLTSGLSAWELDCRASLTAGQRPSWAVRECPPTTDLDSHIARNGRASACRTLVGVKVEKFFDASNHFSQTANNIIVNDDRDKIGAPIYGGAQFA